MTVPCKGPGRAIKEKITFFSNVPTFQRPFRGGKGGKALMARPLREELLFMRVFLKKVLQTKKLFSERNILYTINSFIFGLPKKSFFLLASSHQKLWRTT